MGASLPDDQMILPFGAKHVWCSARIFQHLVCV
jgi:hypothetical protein